MNGKRRPETRLSIVKRGFLSCDGVDTWGSYSLTLIDALDTLAVMGNYSEFTRVYNIEAERTDFDANINMSVFVVSYAAGFYAVPP